MIEVRGLGQEVPERVGGEDVERPTLPGTLFVQRGYVAVPTPDVRAFVQDQAITFGIGFAIGLTIGAMFGNVLAKSNLPVVGR
jgi:hypothetical protein